MGARRYRMFEQHADVGTDECVLEIGSERGEGSTIWFANFCGLRGICFHTIDIDPERYEQAVEITDEHVSCYAHLGFGEDFVANELDKQIRFAYLDGYDCIPEGLEQEDFIEFYRKKYKQLGLVLNNQRSEQSHLVQARAIEQKAASRCAIMIDDTYHRRGRWCGKGAKAMPYLAQQGFGLTDLDGTWLATR